MEDLQVIDRIRKDYNIHFNILPDSYPRPTKGTYAAYRLSEDSFVTELVLAQMVI